MNPTVNQQTNIVLLGSTFVIAVCGLVYELLAGTLSSYLLGDSVYQFSLVIGLFMASMGIGSFLSRFASEPLEEFFITLQIIIGLCGGFSALILFCAFAFLDNYGAFLLLLSIVIGTLIGMEIPVIMRILKNYQIFKINVSNVLTVDYIGALGASLLFPLVLAPQLGLMRTALLFGLLNVFVALVGIYTFKRVLHRLKRICAAAGISIILLLTAFFQTERINRFIDQRLFNGEIIYSNTTSYQNIVITRSNDVISLFINGNLQFNSLDEYRYHESLVHPVMTIAAKHDHVLLLGGGDGLAVREILKYSDVKSITVVDIDPVVTQLFSRNPLLRGLNKDALLNHRVQVVNDDAWRFLQQSRQFYDVMIIDLPDPNDVQVSKLYTRNFYTLAARRLSSDGALVTQATSPFYADKAFWCIKHTLDSVTSAVHFRHGLHTLPYHAYIPTFGEWGFILASARKLHWPDKVQATPLQFLNRETLTTLPIFAADMAEVETEINTLQNHPLIDYYEQGWKTWYE